jgi:hypothetical protein
LILDWGNWVNLGLKSTGQLVVIYGEKIEIIKEILGYFING